MKPNEAKVRLQGLVNQTCCKTRHISSDFNYTFYLIHLAKLNIIQKQHTYIIYIQIHKQHTTTYVCFEDCPNLCFSDLMN